MKKDKNLKLKKWIRSSIVLLFSLLIQSNLNAQLTVSVSSKTVECDGSSGSVTITVSGGTGIYDYILTGASNVTITAVSSPITFTSLSTGSYTLYVADDTDVNVNGSTTFTITAPSPISGVAITSYTNETCSGNSDGAVEVSVSDGNGVYSYTLTSSLGPQTGSATGSPFTISGLGADNYVLDVKDGCGSNYTNTTFTITAPPALSVSVSVTDATSPGCANGSATVNVTGGTSPYNFTWNPSVSSSSNIATNLNGTSGIGTSYTVTVVDQNSCSSVYTFTVDCVTGIESIQVNSGIAIYPNPTNGQFNVVIDANLGEQMEMELTDVTGKTVLHIISRDAVTPVNISELANGIYFYTIKVEGVKVRGKVVKE
jgi:hypothetical protein